MARPTDVPAVPPPSGASPFSACALCPRACGVDRTRGPDGVCGETAVCRLAAAVAHFGEEPPLSGFRGSGTLFFSGCPCRCFFCQNHQISTGAEGRVVTDAELAAEAMRLVEAGVHNLNFVTPDHVWPHVERLIDTVRAAGADLPMVFNGSGYHRADGIARIARRVEIFLPDFKFADPELAECCMGDADYPRIALEAIDRMIGECGFLEPFDPGGRPPAREGVLVRHLVLPGEEANSLRALRLLRERFGRWLPLSIMSQFRPVSACTVRGQLTRPVSAGEYRRVCEEAADLGFEQVFLQPEPADDAFLPDFRQPDPFRGNALARDRRDP